VEDYADKLCFLNRNGFGHFRERGKGTAKERKGRVFGRLPIGGRSLWDPYSYAVR